GPPELGSRVDAAWRSDGNLRLDTLVQDGGAFLIEGRRDDFEGAGIQKVQRDARPDEEHLVHGGAAAEEVTARQREQARTEHGKDDGGTNHDAEGRDRPGGEAPQ